MCPASENRTGDDWRGGLQGWDGRGQAFEQRLLLKQLAALQACTAATLLFIP